MLQTFYFEIITDYLFFLKNNYQTLIMKSITLQFYLCTNYTESHIGDRKNG